MAWSFNNIRIFVQERTGTDSNVIARLQPLSGPTVTQSFGFESEIIKISAIVVGDSDLDALKECARSHDTYTFNGYGGYIGDYQLKSISWKDRRSICQTIRTDLPEDSPVYDIELELYE